VLDIFRYQYVSDWHFLGDTNLVCSKLGTKPMWLLTDENTLHYANAVGEPSIMLDPSLFDYDRNGYISNPIDEILEMLPEEVQNEILFNLHLFTGSKSA